ncbi:dual specificity protein [Lynx pardinus]|uniref:protein-tyrosine-phosphatase n=1 Tax=Lynx pardinus TaxID=191816 RepID=A0A485NPI2_LYNPA|nr:dual specificity protein [Lynx pardinus]
MPTRQVTLTTCSVPNMPAPFPRLCLGTYPHLNPDGGLHRPSEPKLPHLQNEGNRVTLRGGDRQVNRFFPYWKVLRQKMLRCLEAHRRDAKPRVEVHTSFPGEMTSASLFFSHAGVSRSVAIITAFLMKTDQLTFEKAYENLQTIKPEAKMNEGFEWQLKLYQAMGYEVDTSSAVYKQYRLQKVTEKYPELQNLPQELFAVDPTTISQGLKDEVLYKCRKCRRSLFRSSSILDHNEGSGPIAFAHKRVTPSLMLTTGGQAQCTSYFIEPVQWMESALLGVMDGQLLCPKCNAKLGSFNWYGEQCSCGRWITPAFQIHKNRVDEMKTLPVLGSQTRKI